MFQIIEEQPKRPSFGRELLTGFGESLPGVMEKLLSDYEVAKENEALGIPKGVRSDKLKQILLQTQGKQQLNLQDMAQEQESYETIKERFGENFAKVWKAIGKGEGRTNLTSLAVEAKERGLDLDQMFQPLTQQADQIIQAEQPERLEQIKQKPEIKEKGLQRFPVQEIPKGMTFKEKNDYKKELRKENLPIFKESKDRFKAAKGEKLLIDKVNSINESHKLPEGVERLLINPATGEPYSLAQLAGLVNADTQTFLKTINEFTTKAKDTYGSRVTNFDLQQYMKRLPGLLNTYEGRKNIIKMMRITNEITQLREDELKSIYDHYGLEGIPPEKAEMLASENIAEKEEKLVEEFNKMDRENEAISSTESTKQAEDQIMEELPNPAQNKGKRIVDEDTGAIFESDGKTWKKVK